MKITQAIFGVTFFVARSFFDMFVGTAIGVTIGMMLFLDDSMLESIIERALQ